MFIIISRMTETSLSILINISTPSSSSSLNMLGPKRHDSTHLFLRPHVKHGVNVVARVEVGGIAMVEGVCLADGSGEVAMELQQQVHLQLQEKQLVSSAGQVAVVI